MPSPATPSPPDTPPHAAGPPAPVPQACAADGQSGVLDAQALAQVRRLDPDGSARLLGRVLEAYAEALRRQGPQLAAAREGADWPTVGNLAHSLKASSAAVGALRLSRLAAEAEAAVRCGDFAAAGFAASAMSDELPKVQAAVEAML